MRAWLVVLVMACATCATSSSVRPNGALIVLRGVRVIDGQGGPALEDQNIVIEGDHIREIGPRQTLVVSPSARIVELSGKTVYPGLVSDHSHVGITEGLDSGAGHYTRQNVLRQLEQYEAYGVTTIMSLGFNTLAFYDLQAEVRQGNQPAADLFGADRGIGVPNGGPPVPVGDDQLYRPNTVDEARAAVREMAERHPTLIKIWLDDFAGTQPRKMSPDISHAIIDEAHRAGLRVAAHVYYLEDARRLLGEGVDVLAHGVRDRDVDDAFVAEMHRRHVWYVATLDLDESAYIYAERPEWMDTTFFQHAVQPEVARQLDDKAWRRQTLADKAKVTRSKLALATNQRNLKRLFDAGVRIGFGTDSGANPLRIPGFAEHRELELMTQAGFTPLQALHIATREAAALLGLDDRGTIAPGKLADLVVVDGKPDQNIVDTRRIVAVWKRGREVRGGVERFVP